MNAANNHVLSHGMQDTRETLEAWSDHPWAVLRSWLALSVAIALTLLGATWFVAGQLTPDLTPIHLPGLTERSSPADMLPILWRNSLVLALHGFACLAGFIAGASMPLAAAAADRHLPLGPRQDGRVRDPLRLRGDPVLALHAGPLPRIPGLDHRLPARYLAPGPDPHRPPARDPRAQRAVPAARRLVDRQPPGRVEPTPRGHPDHRPARDSGPDHRGGGRGLRLAPHPRSRLTGRLCRVNPTASSASRPGAAATRHIGAARRESDRDAR